MEIKICSNRNCQHNGKEQFITNFVKNPSNKSGYRSTCKDCHKEYLKEYKTRNVEYEIPTMKICCDPLCNNPGPKLVSEFYKQKTNKSGYRSRCIDCISRERNEKRDQYLEYERKYFKEHPGYNNYKASQYRSALLQATPKWANLEKIKLVYIVCSEMNEIYDTNNVVDHIIPLRGKNVSGLHVENNLQILSFSENSKKSNRILD